jgi:hypothetical protein
MEDSEHRALWGALGVAVFISGVVVLSDWSFAVAASTSKRDLATLWWPWVGAVVLMVLGVYILSASASGKGYLPGRKELARRRTIRGHAEVMLAFFHNRGSQYSLQTSPAEGAFLTWYRAVDDYVTDTWGIHESTVLRSPGPAVRDQEEFQNVTRQLARLIERCRILPIQEGYNAWAVPKPAWLEYVDDEDSYEPEP